MNLEKNLIVAQNDPVLHNLILQLKQPTFESTNHVFHDLMSCIIEQQIHYRTTKKIFANALKRANITLLTLDNFEQFEKFGLSAIKLSANKFETILRIIDFWKNSPPDFTQLSNQDVMNTLKNIKGIGLWTINMILLYTLKRPDVFPDDDFHLKQIMVTLYGLNPKNKLKLQMNEIAKKWGNYQSVAVLYLLASKKML